MSREAPLVPSCSGLKLVFYLSPQAHRAPAPPSASPQSRPLHTLLSHLYESFGCKWSHTCCVIQAGNRADWNPWLRGQLHTVNLGCEERLTLSVDQEAAFGLSSGWVQTQVGLEPPHPWDRRNLSKSSEEMGEDNCLPMDNAENHEMGLGREGCILHVVFSKPGTVGIQEHI